MIPKRVQIITMGCPKNTVDSEKLARQLQVAGHTVFYDLPYSPNNKKASYVDAVLINTCGFIGDAKEESIEMILNCVESKQRKLVSKIYVFGCLSQRYKKDLQREIPEVDAFFGVNDFDKILEALDSAVTQNNILDERVLSTPSHYAYLKISEGCNWGCSYCAIPLIRGKHVSSSIESLVSETEKLAAKGVKELLVIAQDTTFYGVDIYGKRRLGDLLNALSEVNGIEWIRLHYAYPVQFPKDVINALRENKKMCKYIDIPLQHVSDKVLTNMRRGVNGDETRRLVDQLRSEVPNIAIRTTLMVGHPGEDEQAFGELKQFVKDMRFERLGVFCYSEEEGTYGAAHFTDHIPKEVKEARKEEIMSLQLSISEQLNESKIGSIFRTIIDREEGLYLVGRTQYDSPEVDGEFLIDTEENLEIGNFYDVRVTSADAYDLYGTLC